MNTNELTDRLLSAVDSGDLAEETEEIVADLKAANCGLDAVKCILTFMEKHPEVDFGTPGPLVHFVERFYKQGYEITLLDSISRQPTSHTVWMLNRVINGTKSKDDRAMFVGALKAASKSERADSRTRKVALHFLDLHV